MATNITKTSAIIAVNNKGDDYTVTPLFVSVTAVMNLTDHEGVSAGDSYLPP
ncbi:MAG: hypothetical protein WBE37_32140 [Bryobacteraceae bacterium]